jgi:segregation and condensation protein B
MKSKSALPEHELTARIEAALYSAGRPLSLEELATAGGIYSKPTVLKIVTQLIDKTRDVFKAIEITRLEDGNFVFQVKPDYTPLIRRFAQQPVISIGALKTLSYIAYEQPLTSTRLYQIRGGQVYRHIRELIQMDFIEYEKVGRLKVYSTTKKFEVYFGITDLKAIKKKLLATPKEDVDAKK